MNKLYIPVFIAVIVSVSCNQSVHKELLMSDEFSDLERGPFGSNTGAHTEYHYLPGAKPKGNWAIATHKTNLPSPWSVRDINGKRVLLHNEIIRNNYWHPMVVAGDELWENYTLKASFSLLEKGNQTGIMFRYRNSRCYYFLGVEDETAVLKMVNHALDYHQPLEIILGSQNFSYKSNEEIKVSIDVSGDNISASFENGPVFTAVDSTFSKGKIGFLSNGTAYISSVEVICSPQEKTRVENLRKQITLSEQELASNNPQPVLWKKINVNGFGVGRNLRFGDLNNDGVTDVLVGQVVHHGPKDRNSELSCLTAMTFDGEMLWQKGSPDLWKDHLTNDVAFQIHDIDNDGRNEVIYCMNFEMIIADAETGNVKHKAKTPLTPGGKPTASGQNIYERILGDCFYFCDLQGQGYDGSIILKDRYKSVWAFNNKFELLWNNECITGHYPYAYDTDGDGKDELMMGYTLFDSDGTKLWTLDETIRDHADGVAIAKFKENSPPRLLCAASDQGIFFADMEGTIMKHHFIGHVQNPAIANFRDDSPGLEAVSINFWGNQGILHFYDSEGDIYHDFEPNHFGSMCLPLNWTGRSEEFFIHNTNVDEGGAYDGWGRKVLHFPDDGHPDMCYAVMDITGDCRDEIVVWDPSEIWVYTQDDSPRSGKLYKPERNALYNYSNYQATASLPGWNE